MDENANKSNLTFCGPQHRRNIPFESQQHQQQQPTHVCEWQCSSSEPIGSSSSICTASLRWTLRCLLLLVGCVLSSGVLTTASSNGPPDNSYMPEVVSHQQQQQSNSHASLVQSVWDTIRASLEAAAVTRKSSGSNPHLEDGDDDDEEEVEEEDKKQKDGGSASAKRYPQTVTPRNDQLYHQVTSRRRALLEQSLRQHYSKFLNGRKHLDASYFSRPQRRTTTSHGDDKDDSDDESEQGPLSSSWAFSEGCLAFNEHRSSHWTFILCHHHFVHQVHFPLSDANTGNHHDGGSLQHNNGGQSHELGTWRSENQQGIEPPWHLSWTQAYLEHLAKNTPALSQRLRIDEYADGDWCQPLASDAIRRETLVVMLTEGESLCKSSNKNNKNNSPRIRLVEEPLPCRYVIHICTPPDNDVNSLEESKAEMETSSSHDEEKQGNDTRHNENIKNFFDFFLHQSNQDKLIKAMPDRTTALDVALPPFPQSMHRDNLQLLQDMFRHGYDAYMYHAYPAPELKPISCKPGTFQLVKLKAVTLIDALDTLVVLGNYTEFARSVERLRLLDHSMRAPLAVEDEEDMTITQGGLFAVNQNVSVFETNIRVLGGLLSAHQLAEAYLKNRVVESNVWDWKGDIWWGEAHAKPTVATTSKNHGRGMINSCSADLQLDQDCSVDSTLQCVAASPTESAATKDHLKQCRNTTAELQQEQAKQLEPNYWTYDGFLLTLAHDLGTRLLPAFDSKTGIPYGTVNLLYGVPKGETTIASLAGGGTLTLEMELLSRLTGDQTFGRAAKLASRALWSRRSSLNLFGKHINIHNGEWTETLSGIGSNSDSFYEYLVKHYILFPEDEGFWTMMISAYTGVHNSTRLGEWYADVDMNLGTRSGGARRVFESLMAFYPGMQVLLGELPPAARTLNSFFMVREFLGFLPERFNYANWRVDGGLRGAGRHPLRPEILESCYFMHQATKGKSRHRSNATSHDSSQSSTSGWLWAAHYALHALESMTRVECGYASVKDLSPTSSGSVSMNGHPSPADVKLYNEMPSFFLSETLKYLYLTFDDDNVLHTDEQRQWIFTTEAHPIHHEPVKKAELNRNLKSMKQSLKRMLKSRLYREGGSGSRKFYERSSVASEKWTEHTKLKSFRTSFESAVTELRHRGKEHRVRRGGSSSINNNITGDFLIEPIVPSWDMAWGNDHFGERVHKENLAHLSFAILGVGEGSIMKKACFNIYNPEFLWLRALHGGGLDYADVYVSAAADEPGKEFQPANRYMLLGSADALGYQGSGVYLGLPELQRRPDRSCPLSLQQTAVSKPVLEIEAEPQGPPDGAVRYDMGPNVGSFDVSVFADGGGFYVQHVETKERVIATVIVEESSKDTYVMAYTSMPPLPESSPRNHPNVAAESSRWARWKNMFRRNRNRQGSTTEDPLPERSVVLSDIEGNAFICEIRILLRSTVLNVESNGNDEDELGTDDSSDDFSTKDEVLAHFPCAPGFFGAAHISNLIVNDGLVVEEVLRAPDGDEFGCSGDYADAEIEEASPVGDDIFGLPNERRLSKSNGSDLGTCKNAVIQVVRRGTCTFETKSMNQKRQNSAAAVIVVNDVDEDLFVMSRGHDTEDKPSIPVTVLVTGADGEGILSLISDHAKGEGHDDYLVARISLIRQGRVGSNQEGQFLVDWSSETPVWPIMRASSDAIQIFARGGWGVHAMRSGDVQVTWQLFLLQHQLHARGSNNKDD